MLKTLGLKMWKTSTNFISQWSMVKQIALVEQKCLVIKNSILPLANYFFFQKLNLCTITSYKYLLLSSFTKIHTFYGFFLRMVFWRHLDFSLRIWLPKYIMSIILAHKAWPAVLDHPWCTFRGHVIGLF